MRHIDYGTHAVKQNEEIELLGCPFCAGEAEMEIDLRPPQSYYVQCISCGSCAGHSAYEIEAIEFWNVRDWRNIDK